MYCSRCGKRLADHKTYCDKCGTTFEVKISDSYIEHLTPLQKAELQFSMQWFKFLIYFSLFAGAILNIGSGARMISGANFLPVIYEMLPGLRILCVCIGILMFGLGVFQVIIRFQLAKFKKNAPILLLFYYFLEIVVEVVYILGFSHIFSDTEFSVVLSSIVYQGICGFGMNVFVLICSYFYFKRRNSLFIN